MWSRLLQRDPRDLHAAAPPCTRPIAMSARDVHNKLTFSSVRRLNRTRRTDHNRSGPETAQVSRAVFWSQLAPRGEEVGGEGGGGGVRAHLVKQYSQCAALSFTVNTYE